MIKHMAALLLLAFMLMGCFVDPGGGWGDRDHHQYRFDQGEHGGGDR